MESTVAAAAVAVAVAVTATHLHRWRLATLHSLGHGGCGVGAHNGHIVDEARA